MFQQTILIGHLGNDPEMRFTNTGVPVASFRMAVSESWNDAGGNRQQKVTWFTVTAWRKTAELATQYLKKGSKVQIVGKMEEPRAFVGKDGNMRASNEITVNTLTFLDSRQGDDDEYQAPRAAAAPQQSSRPTAHPDPEEIPF